MSGCLLVRLRPDGPWRMGPATGARDRVEPVFHSDSLYSAVCAAMREFGWLEEWLDATARAASAQVRLSSLFPWQGEHLYVPGPRHLWPPAGASKLRARGAQFVPASVIAQLARGSGVDEDKWEVDGASECLVRAGRRGAYAGPFRVALRSNAAVDRIEPGKTVFHQTACVEFAPNAGMWCVAEFADADSQRTWSPKVQACFRLLADSGLGGERTRGWGRSSIEEMRESVLPDLLLGNARRAPAAEASGAEAAEKAGEKEAPAESGWWLLSLYTPAAGDSVDWTRGSYTLVERAGRVESPAGWGAHKKAMRMVGEGSVLLAAARPLGRTDDVAPDGFPHPVYRSGHAVAMEVPWRVNV